MIFTQKHQILDRVAAGAGIDSIAGMVADYLRGAAFREMAETTDQEITEEDLPEITAEDVAAWLSENYADLRQVSYPPWREQMEMQYDDFQGWESMVAGVKAAFPKQVDPENIRL